MTAWRYGSCIADCPSISSYDLYRLRISLVSFAMVPGVFSR